MLQKHDTLDTFLFPKNFSTTSTKALQAQNCFSFREVGKLRLFINFLIRGVSKNWTLLFLLSILEIWWKHTWVSQSPSLSSDFHKLFHDGKVAMRRGWNDFRSFHKRDNLNVFTPDVISSLTRHSLFELMLGSSYAIPWHRKITLQPITQAEIQPFSNRHKWSTCVHSMNFF